MNLALFFALVLLLLPLAIIVNLIWDKFKPNYFHTHTFPDFVVSIMFCMITFKVWSELLLFLLKLGGLQ